MAFESDQCSGCCVTQWCVTRSNLPSKFQVPTACLGGLCEREDAVTPQAMGRREQHISI